MNAMSPWTPAAIGQLTPLQLICLGHERPSGATKPTDDVPDETARKFEVPEPWRP